MSSFHDLFKGITDHMLLNNLILATTVFIIAHISLRLFRVVMNKFINRSSEDLRVDPTKYKFLNNALSFLVYMVALIIIFLAIPELESVGLGLFARST